MTRTGLGRGFSGAVAAVLLLGGGAARAQDPSGEVGGFRLTMSAAEARATAPTATWTETVEGDAQVLASPGAATFAGRAFDVSLRVQGGRVHELTLMRHDPLTSLGECRTEVLAVLGALSAAHGPLVPMADPDPTRSVERIRAILPTSLSRGSLALGRALESPIRQIERIGETRLDFVQNDSWSGTGSWMGVRPADGRRPLLIAGGSYGYGDGPPDCGIQISLSDDRTLRPVSARETAGYIRRIDALARTLPPLDAAALGPPDRLDPATAAAWSASAAVRHRLMSNLPAEAYALLPAEGLTVPLECVVQRRERTFHSRGTPWPCWSMDPSIPAPLSALAGSITSFSHFADADLGTRDDIALLTRIDVRLSPDEVRRPPEASVAVLPMSEVVWARTLPQAWINRHFSSYVREDTTLTAPCEIRDDGSLVCWPDGKGRTERARVFGLVSESYRAGPTLADGSPSAGRWVELTLEVKVAPAPARRVSGGG
ncbi:hypothetical protein [Brevundimonas sp. FT23042]|uniref:hypothetical protein n=1 Tax=Brevundimonas sp. FT23042 TaxID=3393749 RepID=UPI003B589BF9